MAATLEAYLHRMVSIITADGRNFVGTLKGFDQTVNLVLDDTHERVFSSSNGVEQVFFDLMIQVIVGNGSLFKHISALCQLICYMTNLHILGCPWPSYSPWRQYCHHRGNR